MTAFNTRPFALELRFADPVRQGLLNLLRRPVEWALGLERLNQLYALATRRGAAVEGVGKAGEDDFLGRVLEVLKVSVDVAAGGLERVPKSGPLVVVANHPFGGLDGVILAALLRGVRPDAKVMANFLLARIPELRDIMFFVDPFGGKEAARGNVAALRQSIEHVRGGGALVVFPAGEVSHVDIGRRAILDPKWSETVARIVRRTQAMVLPVFFHGNNSGLFNVLGMMHPLMRTALLPREMIRRERSRVAVEIGNAVGFKKLASFGSDGDMTAYLRLRTYILRMRRGDAGGRGGVRAVKPEVVGGRGGVAVAAAEDAGLVREEVGRLADAARVIDTAEFAVYVAEARAIPHTLWEIGRLREITFRVMHEGTGKAIDLDEFDASYLHLFCWSKTKQEVVGAYRIGQTDVILPARGVKGLYTRTLFRFDAKLMEQIGPALELGRSFVRGEYQRSYAPLLLLWKGLGAFAARRPYPVLFGPVSINREYQSVSRQLIMAFLRATSLSPLGWRIRAKHPPRMFGGEAGRGGLRRQDVKDYSMVVRDLDEVSDLVEEIEADGKGIPVLLKQYMKLSARFLGFNMDPEFGDVLDGLVLVDLRRTDERVLGRFVGEEGVRRIRGE